MKYKPPPDHLLSDDDVAMFWEALGHWQTRLGLQDWRITPSMRPPAGAMSMMDKWDWPQRQVRCRLNRNWKSEKPSPENISQTALHELRATQFEGGVARMVAVVEPTAADLASVASG